MESVISPMHISEQEELLVSSGNQSINMTDPFDDKLDEIQKKSDQDLSSAQLDNFLLENQDNINC